MPERDVRTVLEPTTRRRTDSPHGPDARLTESLWRAAPLLCHSEPMAEQLEDVDFAVAAFREDGEWRVQELVYDLAADVDTIAHALRRFPSDAGALGLVGIDEDFFLLIRVDGSRTRVLLSDITAADEWEIAASAVEFLHLPMPDDDDDQVPAGELDLIADLGMSAGEMGELIDDVDLYPDEMLSEVARQLGFGELFDDVVDLASA